MVDELTPNFRKACVDGFFALYEGDARQIVDALIAAEVSSARATWVLPG